MPKERRADNHGAAARTGHPRATPPAAAALRQTLIMAAPRQRAGDAAAIALMTGANVLFAFNDVWLRHIADDIGIIQTIWGRSVLFLAIMLLVMNRTDWHAALGTHKPHLQIIRGTFPVIGAVLMIAAMGMIPVADATAMFFLSPLLASLLAMPLLREKMRVERWLALALGIAGMLVIVRPGAGAFQLGHVWALTCAGVIAFYQIFTAFVTRHSNAKTTLFFMAATATVTTSIMVPFVWQSPSAASWLALLGTSLIYAVGHGMYIVAHARAETTQLAPFVYTQLFGSLAAGWLFYGQTLQLYTVFGAGLIALGGCMVLLRRTAR
jgi:drug/metabolite transporter (DMT)-like permease